MLTTVKATQSTMYINICGIVKFQWQKLWLFDSRFPHLKFQLCNCISLTNYDYQTVQLESLSKQKGRRGREGKVSKGDIKEEVRRKKRKERGRWEE